MDNPSETFRLVVPENTHDDRYPARTGDLASMCHDEGLHQGRIRRYYRRGSGATRETIL